MVRAHDGGGGRFIGFGRMTAALGLLAGLAWIPELTARGLAGVITSSIVFPVLGAAIARARRRSERKRQAG